MSHREFLVWKRHFDNNPPIECYLMQIAAELEMSRTLKPVSVESKRLRYEDNSEEKKSPVTPDEVKAVSEARRKMLLARIGGRKDGNGRRS